MIGNYKKEFGFKMICNGNAKWVIRTTNVYEDYLYSMITFNGQLPLPKGRGLSKEH